MTARTHTPRRSTARLALFSLVAVLPLAACGGDGGGGSGPTTGALAIETVTSGPALDGDGYSVEVPGRASVSVPLNGVTYVTGLPTGAMDVAIAGVAPRCAAEGGASRRQTIVRGDTVSVRFAVVCQPTGMIRVRVNTVGDEQDPDGYGLSIDGTSHGAIARNGEVVLRMTPDSTYLWLEGVAPNCQVWDGAGRWFNLASGDTTEVQYDVSCLPSSVPGNTILLRTRTIGDVVDADGYAVWLDGPRIRTIGANETATIAGVAAGVHDLIVNEGPAVCPVSLGHRPDVSDERGVAMEARFFCWAADPGCEPGALQLAVTSGLNPTFTFSRRCHFLDLQIVPALGWGPFWSLGGSNFRPSTFVYGRAPSDATSSQGVLPLVNGHEYIVTGRVWTSTGLQRFTQRFTARAE